MAPCAPMLGDDGASSSGREDHDDDDDGSSSGSLVVVFSVSQRFFPTVFLRFSSIHNFLMLMEGTH